MYITIINERLEKEERELLNYYIYIYIYIYLGFNHGVMNTDNMSILGMLDIKLYINRFVIITDNR